MVENLFASDAGVLFAVVGLILAVAVAFRRSQLPKRSPGSPPRLDMVPAGTCLGLSSVCSLVGASEAGQLLASRSIATWATAIYFFGYAGIALARRWQPSRHHPS